MPVNQSCCFLGVELISGFSLQTEVLWLTGAFSAFSGHNFAAHLNKINSELYNAYFYGQIYLMW